MPIDLRNLRCFLAVCATRSISRAAEHMHIAQPAMSMQIKGLEEALGLQLFERSTHGVQTTAAGLRLEHHARGLLASFESALRDVRQLEAAPVGSVAIGLPQSMTRLLTVPLLDAALKRWPQVLLQIAELSTGYIPEQLLQGRIDIGLAFEEHNSSGLCHEKLAEEKLVLIAPPGAFAKASGPKGLTLERVRFGALKNHPLVLPAPEHGLRILLERHALANNYRLVPVAEVNVIQQLIDVVSSGLGYSLLSYASVVREIKQGTLSAAEIVDPPISRPIYLVQRATVQQSIATSCICNLLRDIAQRLISSGTWPATFVSGR
ncbi:MAG: LysR family transcriptional regulator [Desulfovibrionaceae bacterium]|nr:LysR family transcriptional regulator [Desulfovibrionaceae bacterium]